MPAVQDNTAHHDIAAWLLNHTAFRPSVAIICGSGLSNLSNNLHSQQTFEYTDIPGFPQSTVAGHKGELVFGELNGLQVVCMRGRFHSYEGYDISLVALPARVFRLMGVKLLIVTNAAGGLNREYNIGDIMVLGDHFNGPGIFGKHPLVGPNDEHLGPRFPALSDTYDPVLQELVMKTARDIGIEDSMRPNGRYCFVSGPAYETPMESQFLVNLGGDAVGMSTIPEVVSAKHCGCKIVGLSMITNKVVLPGDTSTAPASHAEVLENIGKSTKKMEDLVKHFISVENLGVYLGDLDDAPAPLPRQKRLSRGESGAVSPTRGSRGFSVIGDDREETGFSETGGVVDDGETGAGAGAYGATGLLGPRHFLVGVIVGVAASFAVKFLESRR